MALVGFNWAALIVSSILPTPTSGSGFLATLMTKSLTSEVIGRLKAQNDNGQKHKKYFDIFAACACLIAVFLVFNFLSHKFLFVSWFP